MWGKNKARHGIKHRQTLSLALAVTVLCTLLPGHVFALDPSAPSEYLCGHVHDGTCGYVEGSEGTPCTHIHGEECGYVEGAPCTYVHTHNEECGYAAGSPCTYAHTHDEECGYNAETGEGCTDSHTHDEACGYVPASPCTDVHVHDEACGYIEAAPCTHDHNEKCGYKAPVAAAPCTHVYNILSFNGNTAGTAISTYEAAAGATGAEISAALPATLSATLACKAEAVNVPVTWSCADYTGAAGTYSFRAALTVAHCAYAVTDDAGTADINESLLPFIAVTVPEAPPVADPPAPAAPTTLTSGAVTVTGVLPEGAYLAVTEVPVADALALLGDEDAEVLFAYDIKIMLPGALDETTGERGEPTEYQPDAENPVTVTITQAKPIDAPTVEVTHIAEDAATGEKTPQSVVTVTPAENTVEFQTESFSVFIGTTDKPAESCPPEIYWNGTNFFADEACTEIKKLFFDDGKAYSNLPLLLNDIDGDTTIYMKAEYLVGSGTQTLGSSHTITLKRHSSYQGALITVSSDATLTLNSITIDGGAADATPISATDAAISVQGSLTMNNGAVVRNNAYNGGSNVGGGVNMLSGSGVFTMTGGTISGNSSVKNGGGVYIDKDATFNMSGGTISGNTATGNGGGVYINSNGTCSISGGTISGNTATGNGGGVYNNSELNVSGSPNIADTVYLATGKTIYVNDSFSPAVPVPVNGQGWSTGTTIASYASSLIPKASAFAPAGFLTGVSRQSIVLMPSPADPAVISFTVPLNITLTVNNDKTLSYSGSSYAITNNGTSALHVEKVSVTQLGAGKPVLVADTPDAAGEISLTLNTGSDSIPLVASEGTVSHSVPQQELRRARWNIDPNGGTLPITFSNGEVYALDSSWVSGETVLFRITYTIAAGSISTDK